MSVAIDRDEKEKKVVKLSAAEVKSYETRFSQSVVKISNLQLNECIGKGTTTWVIIVYKASQQRKKYIVYLESFNKRILALVYMQVHLVKCLKAC